MYYCVCVQTEQELYPHIILIKIHKTQSYILFVPRRANRRNAVTGSFFLNWSNSLIPTSLIPATSLLGGRFLYITVTHGFQSSVLGFLNELFPQLRTTHYYYYYYFIIGIQPLGRSGQRPELSQATGMALVRCILGKFLGVACHCFPLLFRCSHFSPPGASTSATM